MDGPRHRQIKKHNAEHVVSDAVWSEVGLDGTVTRSDSAGETTSLVQDHASAVRHSSELADPEAL